VKPPNPVPRWGDPSSVGYSSLVGRPPGIRDVGPWRRQSFVVAHVSDIQ
jgi:hypothetical protein